MRPAIAIKNLSKRYRLGGARNGDYRTLRESLTENVAASWRRLRGCAERRRIPARQAGPPSGNAIWAVKDISFDVQVGEVLGVIGRNGAGKSTLLKILSRITEPTSGRAELRGRLGSLLEVGTGFHHELTGRENIYLNGAILGMSKRQIARKFDEIVAFAEVEQFLETPVKRYSSGMFVKLAFAVASHMEPEVLVIDEVLAVGDVAFQRKCLGKMDEVGRSGRTVLFVSHNMATILHLCDKVAVLEKGRLSYLGECERGVELYTQSCSAECGSEVDLTHSARRRTGCPTILGNVRLLNSAGEPTDQVLCGEPLTIEVELDSRCPVGPYHVAVGFDDTLGCRLFTAATYLSSTLRTPSSGTRRYVCNVDELPLAPGRYALTLNAGPQQWVWTDFIEQALWFEVTATDFYGNGKLPNAEWGRFLVRSRWNANE